jgi:hypothetical protein
VDADIVYGSGRSVVTKTHLSTGQVQDITPIPLKAPGVRVDRTEPLFFSPQDPHHMYYAANRLYETTDAGVSWRIVSPDLSRENPGSPASAAPSMRQALRRCAKDSSGPALTMDWCG